MAIRTTTHVLKNSDIVNRPLPSVLLKGEPIINTADGIMYFSGVTTSTNEWTPAGTGSTANFFEVGSNLYDLRLRNKITAYNDLTNLSGKFLSGTTNGFELADISSIVGVDTYVTGFTYNNNVITISQTSGGPTKTVLIDIMSGLTVNGTLSATTANIGTENVNTLNATGATITNLDSTTINVNTLNATGGTITTNASNPNDIVNYQTLTSYTETNDVYVTGATYTGSNDNNNQTTYALAYHGVPIGGGYTLNGEDTYTTGGTYNSGSTSLDFTRNDGSGFSVSLADIDLNDTFVTGGTMAYSGPDGTLTLTRNDNVNVTVTGLTDIYTTGGTYNAGTLTLNANNNTSFTVTGLTSTDTFVTGFTYNPSTNTFTVKQNQGQSDLTASFDTVSGLTVSNLTNGRVVYVGTSGLLTNEAGFEYNDGTDTLSITNIEAAGNVVIQGDLTVFGSAISAFTNELYVEDSNITLNYNPTGSTTVTSIGAGWTVQDGNGVIGGDVKLNINRLDTLTGLTGTQVPSVAEYTSSTGYTNRGWITQLNDIVIRSTNVSTPNGVRVLAEFDVLDGGSY